MPIVNCPDIKVSSGTATSSWVKSREVYDDADVILLLADAAGDATKTYTIQITPDPDAAVPVAYTWNDGVNPISAPTPSGAPSNAIEYPNPSFKGFRILASANVGADTIFHMQKHVSMMN